MLVFDAPAAYRPTVRLRKLYRGRISPRSIAKRNAYALYLKEAQLIGGLERELRKRGYRWRDFELRRIPQFVVKSAMEAVIGKAIPDTLGRYQSRGADTGQGAGVRP